MTYFIIILVQLFLLSVVFMTFEYENKIWNVLAIFSAVVPILGIIILPILIGVSAVKACEDYRWQTPTIKIKETKLNKYLYSTHFKNKKDEKF